MLQLQKSAAAAPELLTERDEKAMKVKLEVPSPLLYHLLLPLHVLLDWLIRSLA